MSFNEVGIVEIVVAYGLFKYERKRENMND